MGMFPFGAFPFAGFGVGGVVPPPFVPTDPGPAMLGAAPVLLEGQPAATQAMIGSVAITIEGRPRP